MTETLTLTRPSLMDSAEMASATFGFWDCDDLATASEMAAANNRCIECDKLLLAKIGGRVIPGKMLGTRPRRDDEWSWYGPLCNGCNEAHGVIH